MKTRLLLSFILFSFALYTGIAQVPQGFNYQAIARDGSGAPMPSSSLQVRLTIQSSSTGGTIFWQELHSAITTNGFGLFTLVVGTGVKQAASTVSAFNKIQWDVTPKYIKTEVYKEPGPWKDMGTTQLWAVPYSLVADSAKAITSGTKLSVKSANDGNLEEALFEVKRKDGQTVFAVYPEAVNVYVPRTGKGKKGGFAVGGFDGAKADPTPQDYFRVTPDSVRIYIDPTPALTTKGTKGGFAVGGYGEAKGINDMYFNLSGAQAVNTVTASPQILWYPKKNAFLAGNVHIGSVDSVGDYSTALGYQSIAMGQFSQAFGFRAKALGNYSTSIGKNSVAGSKLPVADNAFALGDAAKATGSNSYAFGSNSAASAPYSVAIGYGAKALGSYGHSFGLYSEASGMGSLALGMYAKSAGQYGASMGYFAEAKNIYSVAVGFYAKAQADYSGAFGRGAISNGASSIAVGYNAQTALTGTDASAFGKNSLAGGPSSVAIGYGSSTGATATDASAFGRTAVANGTSAMALGTNTTAGGNYSTAVGYGASAAGTNAISIGINTTATLSNSVSFGSSAQATNTNALAIGNATIASGPNSTAIGYQSQAQGDKSIAIGSYYSITFAVPRIILTKGGGTKGAIDDLLPIRPIIPISTLSRTFTRANIAQGQYSVAVGNGNLATNGGFVFGSNSDALEFGAVALGTSAAANNKNSIAIGYNTVASGVYSTAVGNNVTATSYGEFAFGQYGEAITGLADQWNENDLLFTIGNGIDDANRSNALTLYKNGKSILRGRFAVSTFNYKTSKSTYFPFPFPHFITKDYVYGIYTNLSRDDVSIEYYYSGFFTSTGSSGIYKGLYADLFTTPGATITDLTVSNYAYMPGVYNTAVGATYRDLYIDNTGLMGYLSSSIRYKKDIEELSDINWLYDLRPVTYRYKDSNSDEKEIGLIAEDVLKINPHYVSFNSNGDPETVSYSTLITPLLKAVQDQKKTIESLKVDNDDLRKRLDELEKVVNSLASEKK